MFTIAIIDWTDDTACATISLPASRRHAMRTIDAPRQPIDAHDDARPGPGLTVAAWTTGTQRAARLAQSAVVSAECTCPTDCIRDHENE
jgi:hypothetical protein